MPVDCIYTTLITTHTAPPQLLVLLILLKIHVFMLIILFWDKIFCWKAFQLPKLSAVHLLVFSGSLEI